MAVKEMPAKADLNTDNVDLDNVDDLDEKDRGDVVEDEAEGEVEEKPKKSKKAAKEESEEEDDAEDDDTEDDDTEDEDEEPAGKGKKGKTIPYDRFDRVNNRRKEAETRAERAERELNDLRSSQKNAEKLDSIRQELDTLYEEVEKKRVDGDFKEAARLQKEIDSKRDNLSRAETKYVAKSEAVAAQRQAAYDAALEVLEQSVPELNEDSEDFDAELAVEVAAVAQGYETTLKLAPHAALRRAAKRVLGRDVFAEPKSALRRSGELTPKKTDVKKNLAAEKAQAAKLPSDKREKAGKIDPTQLTEEEFDALPESKKRALRGDEG